MKREEHAARINAAWQQGVEAVIETGLRIIDARKGLEYGEFEKMVRNDLHISPGTARKLLAIASNKILIDRSHVNDLPASWGTLYELTSAEHKGLDLEAAIKSGAIHPKMERKDIRALLPPPPQRDDDLDESDDTVEQATNPLAVAWESASREERASFLYGLGREVPLSREERASFLYGLGREVPLSREERANFLGGLGREVLLEALAVIDAADKRTAANGNGADHWAQPSKGNAEASDRWIESDSL